MSKLRGRTAEIAPPKVLPRLFLADLYLTASLPRTHNAAMAVPMMHIRRRSWMMAEIRGIRGRDVDDIFGLLAVSLHFAKMRVLVI